MHWALNLARCPSFIHRSDIAWTPRTTKTRTSWGLLWLTTHPERTSVIWFGPSGPGSTPDPTCSQSGGNICTTCEQFVFHSYINLETKTCTYSHENDCSRLTYICPSHSQALQRHTTTRSPPNIDINTCTELWTWLVVSHSYTGQTQHGPLPRQTERPRTFF